ncbi:MAG: hypothetical protein OEV93_00510 [Candidatus Moranbacteria bacterium]|nr:hypothetical protein [Candidatus Moranbacteria bacterium]
MSEIKKIFWSFALFSLLIPVVAFGQWDEGMGYAEDAGLPEGTIADILINVMEWLLSLVGVLGIISFAISGIMYLTAAGDEGRMETAKKTMIWAIIGVIVALAGAIAITTIDAILNADII